MPDPRFPQNPYYYKPLDQAAPIYVPPSGHTRTILPVPQKAGQSPYDYGRPGEASQVYIPASGERQATSSSRAAQAEIDRREQQRTAKMKKYPGEEVAMSDRHSKEQIQKLSSRNDALTAALDEAHAQTGGQGNLPPTEYPRLPSHTQFAPPPPVPSPPAQAVAAQNAGMQQAAAPPPQMAPPPQPLVPTPQAPQGGPGAGFNPGNRPPDLSQLDEAYRRLGANQGG